MKKKTKPIRERPGEVVVCSNNPRPCPLCGHTAEQIIESFNSVGKMVQDYAALLDKYLTHIKPK